MLKYYDYAVTFAEFPREIALCINITGCPNKCKGCSEPWLAEDIGSILDTTALLQLTQQHPGITMIGLMGGDNDHDAVRELTDFVHSELGLKVGMYSGKDELDLTLANVLDYYKIGRWIPFEGEESTWKNQTAGPICLPTSNQVMYKREDNRLIDVTKDFRTRIINNWKTVIIEEKTGEK